MKTTPERHSIETSDDVPASTWGLGLGPLALGLRPLPFRSPEPLQTRRELDELREPVLIGAERF
jgi:hypothetical protein